MIALRAGSLKCLYIKVLIHADMLIPLAAAAIVIRFFTVSGNEIKNVFTVDNPS